jgi:phosphatidylethanolamine-binding protein (PEBP) family uncharacterized protein
VEETGVATGSSTLAQGYDASGASSSPDPGAGKRTSGSQAAAGKPASSGTSADGAAPATGQKHGARIAQPTGPAEQAPTSQQIAGATVADMTLQSPAIVAAAASPGRLGAPYTCDGEGKWPQLRWSGVPAGTAELILYAMNVQPVEEQLFVDWAVAGLDPGLTGIEEGKLPKGAIAGTNGFGKRGYEICPAGAGEIYMFAIYALPQALSPPQGFDARELRHQILDVSGNVGLLPAVYERG